MLTAAPTELHDEVQVLPDLVRLVSADDVGVVQASQQVYLIPQGLEDPPLRLLLGHAAHHERLAREPFFLCAQTEMLCEF